MKKEKVIKSIEFQKKLLDKNLKRLIKLIVKRKKILSRIKKIKKKAGLPLQEAGEEREIIKRAKQLAQHFKVEEDVIEKIVKILIANEKKEKKIDK